MPKILLELDGATHKAIRYIANVKDTAMKDEGVLVLKLGIVALAADPEWVARAAAFEDARKADLAPLGVAGAAAPELRADEALEPLDDRSEEVDALIASQAAAAAALNPAG